MMNRPDTLNRSSTRHHWLKLSLCGLAAAAMLISGCKKPPPPPAPVAPPPPPPPPSTIKLEDLSQELHADARVQFTPGMEVREDQADLAKAVIHLADAIAKGDAKASRDLMTRQAQNILDGLEQEGGWKDATSKIEAVRVVYIGPAPASVYDSVKAMGDPSSAMSQFIATLGPKLAELNSAMTEAMKNIPEDIAKKLIADKVARGGLMGVDGTSSPDEVITKAKAAFDDEMKALEAAGVPADQIATLRAKYEEVEQASKGLSAGAAGAAPDTSNDTDRTGVLLAIQDPSGSYLLGWTSQKAFEKWAFSNAPSTSMSKRRASEWDSIGEAGFIGEMLAAAPAFEDAKKGPDGSTPNAPPTSSTPEPEKPSGPMRKNTPAGPVTIPGGS